MVPFGPLLAAVCAAFFGGRSFHIRLAHLLARSGWNSWRWRWRSRRGLRRCRVTRCARFRRLRLCWRCRCCFRLRTLRRLWSRRHDDRLCCGGLRSREIRREVRRCIRRRDRRGRHALLELRHLGGMPGCVRTDDVGNHQAATEPCDDRRDHGSRPRKISHRCAHGSAPHLPRATPGKDRCSDAGRMKGSGTGDRRNGNSTRRSAGDFALQKAKAPRLARASNHRSATQHPFNASAGSMPVAQRPPA
jgi:hypothetical protein